MNGSDWLQTTSDVSLNFGFESWSFGDDTRRKNSLEKKNYKNIFPQVFKLRKRSSATWNNILSYYFEAFELLERKLLRKKHHWYQTVLSRWFVCVTEQYYVSIFFTRLWSALIFRYTTRPNTGILCIVSL